MNLLRKEIEKVRCERIGRKRQEWKLTPMVTVRTSKPDYSSVKVDEVYRIELLLGVEAVLDESINLEFIKQDMFDRLGHYLYSEIFDALLNLRGDILKDISRDKAIKMINEIIDKTR